MISTISTAAAYDRPEGLPLSTARWEAWWCIAANARERGDALGYIAAIAQYKRAVNLELEV